MKTIGIIAEYNPFHNGHAWQIAEARKRTHADYTVVVMSGDFVQRGEPASLDKFTRARMALSCGADLVIELPVLYSCGSAEYFARGAVALLSGLGAVDTLCFGCETEDPAAFRQLSALLAHEPPAFCLLLKQFLAEGIPFPKARLLAVQAFLPDAADDFSALLSAPNNTLGLEYLIACRRQHSRMDFLPILRQGAAYHAQSVQEPFASAAAIRRHPQTAASCMPDASFALWEKAVLADRLHTSEDFSELLHYALLMQTDDSAFLDVTPALSDRIRNLLPHYRSWEQFVALLKTKELTETRVRRCLLHILLGVRKEFFASHALPGLSYARILGFRKDAAPLLSAIKKKGQIPLLSKAADCKKLLSPEECAYFELQARASAIYHSVDRRAAHHFHPYNEYTQQIVLV